MDSGDAAWESILNLPKSTPSEIDIMLHQSHPAILGPTLLVIVSYYVLIVGVRVLGEIALDQFPGLIGCEFEYDVDSVYIPHVDPDGVPGLSLN